MIVAMAQDIRVILIKLADRLHNMRTIEYLGKQKQLQKARETLEVYAPLAHRLGIHTIKWELEDLAFETLHPRKYSEIQAMVNQRRGDREKFVSEAGKVLMKELTKVEIPADIEGRAKHFYSIYEKMAKRGKEFNEIYDLTAMRVLVERDGKEGERDCYGALGIIHSLWKPMPGRFKDYIAMPKFNMYRSLHTTVVGPEGKPLEIQVRTRDMHKTAEYGIAAHWVYKGAKGKKDDERLAWLKQLMDWQQEETDPREFMKSFRTDLFTDEVYVFTPKGEVKSLPAGSTPIDFAYAVHTDVGHRTVGAKVNGRIVPLHYRLASGDFVEILTSKQAGRGPSRDWMSLAASSRARNKIRQWFSRETREETEHRGRETLESALKQHNLPYRKLAGSPLLAQIIRETGFKKAEDFYLALGSGKLQVTQVVNKVLHRLKTVEVVEEEPLPRRPKAREAVASQTFGIHVKGVEDVLVRLAKCCTPVPGDEIVGYISLGKGITIHRADCPNVKALMRNPERFTEVAWDGGASQSFRVHIAVVSWDRPRLLEDVARTFAEHGANIVEYGGHVDDQMAKNWYVAEVGDIKALRGLLTALRNIESVFDAFRVTPN
jgi:guanosine-3',5'-bis(diphosphate) 3'-pyrophosphohydrolase